MEVLVGACAVAFVLSVGKWMCFQEPEETEAQKQARIEKEAKAKMLKGYDDIEAYRVLQLQKLIEPKTPKTPKK